MVCLQCISHLTFFWLRCTLYYVRATITYFILILAYLNVYETLQKVGQGGRQSSKSGQQKTRQVYRLWMYACLKMLSRDSYLVIGQILASLSKVIVSEFAFLSRGKSQMNWAAVNSSKLNFQFLAIGKLSNKLELLPSEVLWILTSSTNFYSVVQSWKSQL